MKAHEFKYIEQVNTHLSEHPDKHFIFRTESTPSGVMYFLIEQDKKIDTFKKVNK